MIIFHGGLPRSGKSYEAMVRRIIEALKAGRGVLTNMEGINHEKIAEAAELAIEQVKEQLRTISEEQSATWYKHSRDNDVVVLDEIQDFNGNRVRMTQEATKAITQHGHRGQDVVIMGQDYRDAHALWRRRIEIRCEFLKLSAIGQENRYSVTTYRHKGGDEWERVGTVVQKYDEKYFGTYKSHTNDDVQTGNYKDARSSLFNQPFFKYVVPVVIVAAIWGAYTVRKFFNPDPPPAKPVVASPAAQPGANAPARAASAPGAPTAPTPTVDARSIQEIYFADLSETARLRLGGVLTMRGKTEGVIEWINGTQVMARMSFEELRQLGVSLIVSQSVVRLRLGNWQAMAVMWPIEPAGTASQAQLDAVGRGQGTPIVVAAPAGPQIVAPSPQTRPSLGTDMTIAHKPI